jgi:hypothetical protein
MTDQDAVAPTGAAPGAETPNATSATAHYESLAELRNAHLNLRDSFGASAQRRSPNRAASIRAFLTAACETGAFLNDAKERRAAQAILDYWSAELASVAGPDDFRVALLQQPDPSRVRQGSEPPPTERTDQRALIRFSAQARRWRDSGKRISDLLRDRETIEEASRVAKQDTALGEFVKASEAAIEQRERFRTIYWSITGGVFLSLVSVAFSIWYFSVLLKSIDGFITQNVSETGSESGLRWLDVLQPFRPPYDLSGARKLSDITLPKLRLYAPNFSGVDFSNVKVRNANLPAASFSGSNFSFDGSLDNDFNGASLQRAQFRSAKIAFTSFQGADLYRAVFDRAVLCEVDFSGANLRFASFWAAKADTKTKQFLTHTAWWQAVGWRWDDIKRLATEISDPVAQAERLKNMPGFKDEVRIQKEKLARSSAGTLERALALNDFAWTHAVWGVDVGPPAAGGAKPPNTKAAAQKSNAETKDAKETAEPDACTAKEAEPKNALDAAEQAVCIVEGLNKTPAGGKAPHTELLSNLRDTLAYIWMQTSDGMPRALQEYQKVVGADKAFFDQGEALFRYAIAQYDQAKGDKAKEETALKNFRTAVIEKKYQPTHELKTLSQSIFEVEKFSEIVEAAVTANWPAVTEFREVVDPVTKVTRLEEKKEPDCPIRKPAEGR